MAHRSATDAARNLVLIALRGAAAGTLLGAWIAQWL